MLPQASIKATWRQRLKIWLGLYKKIDPIKRYHREYWGSLQHSQDLVRRRRLQVDYLKALNEAMYFESMLPTSLTSSKLDSHENDTAKNHFDLSQRSTDDLSIL